MRSIDCPPPLRTRIGLSALRAMPVAYCAVHHHRIQAEFFIEVTARNMEQLQKLFGSDAELEVSHRICCEHLLDDHVSTHLRCQKLQQKNKELRRKTKDLENKNHKLNSYIGELLQQIGAIGMPTGPGILEACQVDCRSPIQTAEQTAKILQQLRTKDYDEDEDKEEIVVDVHEFVKKFMNEKQQQQDQSNLTSVISKAAQASSTKFNKGVVLAEAKDVSSKSTEEDSPSGSSKRTRDEAETIHNHSGGGSIEDDLKAMPPPKMPSRKKLKVQSQVKTTS